MESLSRPFHSRKLSNATTTFSATNAYDGVFSGSRSNYPGASVIDSQDYREIFGSSPAAASIPVLDLSTLREPSGALNLNSNFRSSKPDYSNIFGGFRNEDVAVSYEELFARDKARAPSSTSSSSSDSDNFSRQSSDDLKQFNMSYNKISQKSKDGLDATRHVTQIHDTPGFTRFIDESIPPLMEAKKHESSPVHSRLDSSKQSKHQTIDFKFHASTVSSPDISENAPEVFSHFEEELDVNSAASASTVALKKAIEKAQESIRIAKESVGRKKKGLRSFSSKNFKDSLKVEGEEQKCKVEVKRVFERSQISSDVGWNRKYFNDSEKLSVAKKFIDEIHGKFTESTKENRLKDYTVVSNSTQGTGETKSRSLDSDEKDEHETFSSEVVETEKSRIEILDFLHVDELKEDKDEVRISNAHELVEGFNSLNVSQKVEEDEKKVAQEEVLEQENIENSENTENDRENIDDEESDNRIQESKESLDNFSDQESEIKEESLDNFSDEEHDEILSGDDNVSIETELNDNNVETTQETDNCFEQIGTEENVVQSESSSSEEEEIPETEITNEAEKIADVTEQIKIEVVEKEQKGRIDEVAEREMEREKDRLAVDRAIREARERARERVERAAVEKATEEIRQRMMADAREKAAKVSAQSKLRAERVAVERATSEARQRALEKAMSQKSGTTSESALRSKAKLEKHNRIMERAAKALAEKEKRDLLAQKELAERNRLAENLDAEIKRWSSGKEGNLRALLTTLQYILGGESGWQAVTMPEIVATSAVKKAYRKATLCVHPDKLQQRRASIQQKYICEKVFDLLKAAWSKFNSEER